MCDQTCLVCSQSLFLYTWNFFTSFSCYHSQIWSMLMRDEGILHSELFAIYKILGSRNHLPLWYYGGYPDITWILPCAALLVLPILWMIRHLSTVHNTRSFASTSLLNVRPSISILVALTSAQEEKMKRTSCINLHIQIVESCKILHCQFDSSSSSSKVESRVVPTKLTWDCFKYPKPPFRPCTKLMQGAEHFLSKPV